MFSKSSWKKWVQTLLFSPPVDYLHLFLILQLPYLVCPLPSWLRNLYFGFPIRTVVHVAPILRDSWLNVYSSGPHPCSNSRGSPFKVSMKRYMGSCQNKGVYTFYHKLFSSLFSHPIVKWFCSSLASLECAYIHEKFYESISVWRLRVDRIPLE